MTVEQIIAIVGLTVLGALLIFFLTPKFIYLCEGLGEIIALIVSDVKDALIEAAEEWKDIFKRWQK